MFLKLKFTVYPGLNRVHLRELGAAKVAKRPSFARFLSLEMRLYVFCSLLALSFCQSAGVCQENPCSNGCVCEESCRDEDSYFCRMEHNSPLIGKKCDYELDFTCDGSCIRKGLNKIGSFLL